MKVLIDTNVALDILLHRKDFAVVDYIVTRNTKDYSSSAIPAITPDQFVLLFKKSG